MKRENETHGAIDWNVVRSHYEPRIDRYQDSHEIHDWENKDSQLKRFEVLIESVPLDGKRVLDVGCGAGELYRTLREHGISAQYTGIDLLDKMVTLAQRSNPGGVFVQGDLFTRSPFERKQFDVVFCSGLFNLKMGDNHRLLQSAIPVFFEHAREHVVFNLLTPQHYASDLAESRYYFFEPEEVLPWVTPYASDLRLITGYVPNDFTVVAAVRNSAAKGSDLQG